MTAGNPSVKIRFRNSSVSIWIREDMNMLKEYFYMFILYTDLGKKLKDIIGSLFPGLIREPQRVRVPVRGQDEGRINTR